MAAVRVIGVADSDRESSKLRIAKNPAALVSPSLRAATLAQAVRDVDAHQSHPAHPCIPAHMQGQMRAPAR